MLRHVETFNFFHAASMGSPNYDPEWALEAHERISKLDLSQYPENLGSELWDHDGHEKGKVLLLFCLGAMCMDVMPLTPSPDLAEVFTTAYRWGCEQTDELQSKLAGMLKSDQFDTGGDVSPPAYYMRYSRQGWMVADYARRIAKGTLRNSKDWLDPVDGLVFGAPFRFYHEVMVEYRIFQDQIKRGELVYCRSGVVARNTGFRQQLFGSRPLDRKRVKAEVAEEMRQFVLMLLRQSQYSEAGERRALLRAG